MKNVCRYCFTIFLACFIGAAAAQDAVKNGPQKLGDLKLDMKMLDGSPVDFSKYQGKVVVFVNVASKCGFTPQYEQLQQLHEKRAKDGLAIVGVPCNQFGGQEPGSAEEIAQFCEENYGVEFDMFAKVDVKGDKQSELYKFLTGLDLKPAGRGSVKWNFEKFVLDRSGTPVSRFNMKVKPTDRELVKVLDAALDQTVGLSQSVDGATGAVAKPYAHTSKKLGKEYFLFKKEVDLKNSDKKSTIYFFAKDPENKKGTPVAAIPADRVVSETKTGMLVLKKRK